MIPAIQSRGSPFGRKSVQLGLSTPMLVSSVTVVCRGDWLIREPWLARSEFCDEIIARRSAGHCC